MSWRDETPFLLPSRPPIVIAAAAAAALHVARQYLLDAARSAPAARRAHHPVRWVFRQSVPTQGPLSQILLLYPNIF